MKNIWIPFLGKRKGLTGRQSISNRWWIDRKRKVHSLSSSSFINFFNIHFLIIFLRNWKTWIQIILLIVATLLFLQPQHVLQSDKCVSSFLPPVYHHSWFAQSLSILSAMSSVYVFWDYRWCWLHKRVCMDK